jgi:hypothetical protein
MRNYILCLALGLAAGLAATTAHAEKGAAMTKHASGTFDVTIGPQKDEGVGDPTIGRMSIDKQYHGDLEGTGVIPDSGTEELKGIAGTMTIDIRDGKHFYGFDYTLAQP